MSEDYLDSLIRVTSAVNHQAEYIPAALVDKPELICGPISLTPLPDPMGAVEVPETTKACVPNFFEVPLVPPPFSLPENCPTGITFNDSTISIYDGQSTDPAATITVGAEQSGDFCSYNLTLPPALVIPCYPDGIRFTDVIRFAGFNFTDVATTGHPITIGTPIDSVLDLQHTTEEDPNGLRDPIGCSWGGTTIELPFPVCDAGFYVGSNITVRSNDISVSSQSTPYTTPGRVNNINVTAQGTGYTSVPTVTISTGGSGATATAAITSGKVSSITVTAQGTGYIQGTNIVVMGDGYGATVSPVISQGKITAINVINGGTGYTSARVLISANTALASANLTGGNVSSISLLNGGNGFNSPPVITFTAPGSGSTATATAILTNGVITGFNITNAGSGYTSPPLINIPAPAPTSVATATATVVAGKVTKINVTSAGSGYTTHPGVIITGGGGSGATASVADGFNSFELSKGTTTVDGQTRCDFTLNGEFNLGLNNVLVCDGTGLNPPNVNPVSVTQNNTSATANLQLASTVNDQGYCALGITGTINIPPSSSLGGVIYMTGNYSLLNTDNGKLVTYNSTGNYTLTLPSNPASIKIIYIQNNSSGTLAINPNGNGLDDSTSTQLLEQCKNMTIFSTGTAGTSPGTGYYSIHTCDGGSGTPIWI